jgi:hypothetical protein
MIKTGSGQTQTGKTLKRRTPFMQACFGMVVIFAGLEWKFFIGWFGFLSRPVGKAVYFFFIAIYYMGAGKRTLTWPWEDGFDMTRNLPFLAGAILLVLGGCFCGCFLFPCMGPCCSDRTQLYTQKKTGKHRGSGARTENPAAGGVVGSYPAVAPRPSASGFDIEHSGMGKQTGRVVEI